MYHWDDHAISSKRPWSSQWYWLFCDVKLYLKKLLWLKQDVSLRRPWSFWCYHGLLNDTSCFNHKSFHGLLNATSCFNHKSFFYIAKQSISLRRPWWTMVFSMILIVLRCKVVSETAFVIKTRCIIGKTMVFSMILIVLRCNEIATFDLHRKTINIIETTMVGPWSSQWYWLFCDVKLYLKKRLWLKQDVSLRRPPSLRRPWRGGVLGFRV